MLFFQDPNFDKTIDDFTFKDIECKDKPLKDLLNVVYDRIMKPLWPESSEPHEEKDSEERKSAEQDQVLSILIKCFEFFLYRIHCSLFLSEGNSNLCEFLSVLFSVCPHR